MESTMAERLKKLRENNHLSQITVAKRLGVTPALISAYEKSERKPGIDKLLALADIYHASTDYILGRKRRDDSELLVDISGLSQNQIKIIQDLVDEFASKSSPQS